MMLFNTRAQETGPIQKIFISLFLVIAISIAMFNFINQGLIANYDTPVLQDESAFNTYQESSENLTNELDSLRQSFTNPDATALDKVAAILTGGFTALLELVTGPIEVANDLFVVALTENLNVPTDLVNLAYMALLSIIIFSVLALIMKVRA